MRWKKSGRALCHEAREKLQKKGASLVVNVVRLQAEGQMQSDEKTEATWKPHCDGQQRNLVVVRGEHGVREVLKHGGKLRLVKMIQQAQEINTGGRKHQHRNWVLIGARHFFFIVGRQRTRLQIEVSW